MKHSVKYVDPAVMRDEAEKEMQAVPGERLFNDPQYQKLKERWCAGMFGVGYSKYVQPCEVAINDGAYRADVDFFARAAGKEWGFQLAEVQEPARRRGFEYKQLAAGTMRTFPYEPERGTQEGTRWLADGARRKKEKNYAGSADLHLLLYANFSAQGLTHSALVTDLLPFSTDFASLWVVTSLALCSIFSRPDLGEIRGGWGEIRPLQAYYA